LTGQIESCSFWLVDGVISVRVVLRPARLVENSRGQSKALQGVGLQ
jgi:hypothetical protein